MALHHIQPDQTIAGRRFSVIRDFDRVRLVHRTRYMIDGKPVRRAVWEAAMADAEVVAQILTETQH
jgi:hypothetical protein